MNNPTSLAVDRREETALPNRTAPEGPLFRVLLDFDGTLVEANVAMALVERFCPDGPAIAREVDLALHEGRMTLRQAWAREVRLLPAGRQEEMIEFVRREIRLRAGAHQLLDLLRRSRVPTTVVSGGLDFFIRPVLEREGFSLPILADMIVPSTNGSWKVTHPYGHSTCRLCGICKAKIAAAGAAQLPTVFVEDGSTDRFAAEVATVVFARSRLKDYCERNMIPHFGFDDLEPVAEKIAQWLSGQEPFPAYRPTGRGSSDCPVSSAIARSLPYPV